MATFYVGSVAYSGDDIVHFGVKGMKWGIRRYRNEDGSLTEAGRKHYSKQIDREARKDAKRHVDAQMYYGEGAGTRRKLLKAELSGKMKDPAYKEAFDKYVAKQDRAASAVKARKERHARDTAHKIKSQTKAVIRSTMGISGPILAAAAVAAYNNPDIRSKVSGYMSSAVSAIRKVV